MERLSSITWLGAVAFLLASCSTTPQSFSQTSPPPADRIFKPSSVASLSGRPKAGEAILEIRRDSGALGSGCRYDFRVNDDLVARIGVDEGLRLGVPPGRHLLTLEMGGLMCQIFSISILIQATEGEVVPIRLGIDGGRPFVRRE